MSNPAFNGLIAPKTALAPRNFVKAPLATSRGPDSMRPSAPQHGRTASTEATASRSVVIRIAMNGFPFLAFHNRDRGASKENFPFTINRLAGGQRLKEAGTSVGVHCIIKQIRECSRNRAVLEFAAAEHRADATQHGGFGRSLGPIVEGEPLAGRGRRGQRADAGGQEPGAEVAALGHGEEAADHAVGDEPGRHLLAADQGVGLQNAADLEEGEALGRAEEGAFDVARGDQAGDAAADAGVEREIEGGKTHVRSDPGALQNREDLVIQGQRRDDR
ncbi:MAG: hypothetical protein ACYC8V_10950, partial [Caulobacteraceae bacterium]